MTGGKLLGLIRLEYAGSDGPAQCWNTSGSASNRRA